ncbi:MAG: MBOAT family O-acyltransferase [Chitinophagales bacterium]
MIFTSFTYIYFLTGFFILYWTIRNKTAQNILTLVGSYLFYGWIHPWFCILIASSTLVDYFCGLQMQKHPKKKKLYLYASLWFNLGLLGFFKYFNFFAENIHIILTQLGLQLDPFLLQIFLPIGISFYTFQTLSYTIDIYRGQLKPRKNLLDFAVFVSFFPQLVAGPIERAKRFLPKIENERVFNWTFFTSAFPLLIRGYVKKMVIADNIAVYVDKVFMLEEPTFMLMMAGGLAFSIQIYADFAAYTDIARGSARLLGFELVKNFNAPSLAISPTDFWKRWHISLTSWINDYVFFTFVRWLPIRRRIKFGVISILTMGICGLWHGAAWNFIWWGIFHGLLIVLYAYLGMGGRWKPIGVLQTFTAWSVMFSLNVFSALLFRTPNMTWLASAFSTISFDFNGDSFIVALVIVCFTLIYALPFYVYAFLEKIAPTKKWVHAIVDGLSVVLIALMFREASGDFIYFQF